MAGSRHNLTFDDISWPWRPSDHYNESRAGFTLSIYTKWPTCVAYNKAIHAIHRQRCAVNWATISPTFLCQPNHVVLLVARTDKIWPEETVSDDPVAHFIDANDDAASTVLKFTSCGMLGLVGIDIWTTALQRTWLHVCSTFTDIGPTVIT